jgi:predicted FMN-binding regulatory protein PaiB
MYTPAHCKVTEKDTLRNFIKENGFATIISRGKEYPIATQIPLELELSNCLR